MSAELSKVIPALSDAALLEMVDADPALLVLEAINLANTTIEARGGKAALQARVAEATPKTCASCTKPSPRGARFCAECGCPFPPPPASSTPDGAPSLTIQADTSPENSAGFPTDEPAVSIPPSPAGPSAGAAVEPAVEPVVEPVDNSSAEVPVESTSTDAPPAVANPPSATAGTESATPPVDAAPTTLEPVADPAEVTPASRDDPRAVASSIPTDVPAIESVQEVAPELTPEITPPPSAGSERAGESATLEAVSNPEPVPGTETPSPAAPVNVAESNLTATPPSAASEPASVIPDFLADIEAQLAAAKETNSASVAASPELAADPVSEPSNPAAQTTPTVASDASAATAEVLADVAAQSAVADSAPAAPPDAEAESTAAHPEVAAGDSSTAEPEPAPDDSLAAEVAAARDASPADEATVEISVEASPAGMMEAEPGAASSIEAESVALPSRSGFRSWLGRPGAKIAAGAMAALAIAVTGALQFASMHRRGAAGPELVHARELPARPFLVALDRCKSSYEATTRSTRQELTQKIASQRAGHEPSVATWIARVGQTHAADLAKSRESLRLASIELDELRQVATLPASLNADFDKFAQIISRNVNFFAASSSVGVDQWCNDYPRMQAIHARLLKSATQVEAVPPHDGPGGAAQKNQH